MAYIRSIEASERRQQREAQRRQRELERQAKEQAKLSAIEQARLEVETHQNRIELLLSVHREQGQIWDWPSVLAMLPPPTSHRHSNAEFAARRQACLLPPDRQVEAEAAIAQAHERDDQEYSYAVRSHAQALSSLSNLQSLSRRILAGDLKAYTEALVELSPLGEISTLGSTIHFTAHAPHLLEAVLKISDAQAIPKELKSLTATEKLSVKPMPKARFHELYQEYICGCVLRVAREVFALLPVTTVLITASADATNPTRGRPVEQPVISVFLTRAPFLEVDFDHLDSSAIIESFPHRGEFKTSRSSGVFANIVPFTLEDLPKTTAVPPSRQELLVDLRRIRQQVANELLVLQPPSAS